MRQVTVTEHLLLHQTETPDASGKFTALFYDLILAAKTISKTMNKAGLLDILGATGEINVQGEQVQKLDAYANRVLIHRMERTGVLCAIASEENADFIRIPQQFKQGEYILIFDPLDGSSNVDVNVNVGTIFSILRRKSPTNNDVTLADILQSGVEQVAAGYFLYGPSTMLVYSTGDGVHGFTLDPSVGEFLLSHPNLRIPEQGKVYSVNEGYYKYWDDATREAIEYFKGDNNPLGKPYSARYIGSLVADFHRGLLNGGIYMYPADYRTPGKPKGKLRYLCEASPLAYLAEQAGGAATDGTTRILDLQPEELHERVPLFIGSKNDVEAVATIYKKKRKTAD
ncbi:class 1 fructose-bisphosphatase [Halodesulfovibrio marinisediminis]|uniref:Fructose-1,6-bisphosphatase class 1 n=1 Tax=Halodesulfovibrio marinisediminis DSM 17456 TaxID=1121457 RepID=A0A1N6E5D6_9BACT|nr:class 1 fructose-bisphosphatase [Halodesulfovibrio marinisediminis]SIN78137.1 D-fructose 1,6-bisphosphatase [Halodesulfovibrio marinisediminis DSM 17456]